MRTTIDVSNVEFASFPQRIAARLIDVFVVSMFFALFLTFSGVEIKQDAGFGDDLGLGMWVWFLPILYIAYEVPSISTRGQTLGKRIMGIAIVRTDGLIGIGLDRALTRFLTMTALSMIPFLGLLGNAWFFFDPLRQSIPDKAARTFVIRIPKEDETQDMDANDTYFDA